MDVSNIVLIQKQFLSHLFPNRRKQPCPFNCFENLGLNSWFVLNNEPNPLLKYGADEAKTIKVLLHGL
jgi:hypothetical protein